MKLLKKSFKNVLKLLSVKEQNTNDVRDMLYFINFLINSHELDGEMRLFLKQILRNKICNVDHNIYEQDNKSCVCKSHDSIKDAKEVEFFISILTHDDIQEFISLASKYKKKFILSYLTEYDKQLQIMLKK